MPVNFLKLGATIALQAASMALQASKKTKGPRLDELTVTVADYGTPLPRFLGTRKFACPMFHAEDLKEVEENTKIKGAGKQTTYHYLFTGAYAIADNQIDKVLKIWFDQTLVYDVTKPGPKSFASSLGFRLSQVMRTYLGTEDQMPDPRYVDWCEERYGADSAPAYRGLAYLFLEELPTDNFGNRPPTVEVLAASETVRTYPWEFTAAPSTFINAQFSPDGTRYYSIAGSQHMVWDVPTRSLIGFSADNDDGFAVGGHYAITPSGIFGLGGSSGIARAGLDGGILDYDVTYDGPANWQGLFYAGGRVYLIPSGALTGLYLGTLDGQIVTGNPVDHYSSSVFENVDGIAISLGSTSATFATNEFTIGPALETSTVVDTSAYGSSGGAHGFDTGTHYAVQQGTHLYLIDKDDFSIVAHISGVSNPSNTAQIYSAIPPGTTDWWIGLKHYDFSDLSVIETATITDWSGSVGSGALATYSYDPINDALINPHSIVNAGLTWRFLERYSSEGVELRHIINAMCDAASLDDRITSALTQTVLGYSWTRGDVKSQMEPLLDIHDVDARPHDYSIEFLPRGSSPVGSISSTEFVRGNGDRYRVTEKGDTDLPKILRVNFADVEFDQQINNVLSPLPADAVDSQRDETIDLTTYADTPDGAQQKADRYIRREWNSRETIEGAVTYREMAKEPGDVTTLYLDGLPQNVKLVSQIFFNGQEGGRIDCTWERDEVGFAVINPDTTGPSMENREEQVISIPAPVRGFVIDAPYRWDDDADMRPILYDGAGAYAQLSYPGAIIWERTGDAYDQMIGAITDGATWAICTDALGDANPNNWDRGNSLNVRLQSGSLTSVTEADVDADPTLNLFMLWNPFTGAVEYVNVTSFTLEADGTYTLTGFKRGRRGTEWARADHVGGELLILADSLEVDEMGTDDVGSNLSFKAQAIGRALSSAPVIDIEPYTGASLKPYAPARLKTYFDGTDLQCTITRRTRIGGAWVGGTTIPLSENSEAYEVDVEVGGDVVRTITVTGANTFTYTAAQAAEDGVTLPTLPSFTVYQMSDAVGRGFALAA